MNWVYVVANNSESLGVSTEAVVITPTEALVFSESFGLSAVATPTHSTDSSGVAPAHGIESSGVATEATPTQSTVSTGSSVSKVPFHYTLPMLINFDLALSFSYFQPKRYRKKPRLLLNEMRKDPQPKKKVARL